jgi:pimeloyl-ACP methyl ester carboxylesterase
MNTSMGPAKWLDVAGVRTRYFEAGQGSPAVLIHGGNVGDASSASHAGHWAPVFARLAERHRVLALDRLGQGHTGLAADAAGSYTMRGSIDHTAAFMRELKLGPCHIVGHSRGGYAACDIALNQPELARSCVIIDSATLAPAPERNALVLTANPHPPKTREAARWTYSRYSHADAHITEQWLDETAAIFGLEANAESIRRMNDEGLFESMYSPRLRAEKEELLARLAARGLTRPVLLMWGAQDPTAPLDSGHKLLALLAARQPRAQMHVINRAGHFCYREQPEIFSRVLLEFLEGADDDV